MTLHLHFSAIAIKAVENFEFWGKINNCTKKTTSIDSNDMHKTHAYSECTDNITM